MRTLRVRVASESCFLSADPTKYFSMPRDYLCRLFLPDCFNYEFVKLDEPADVCIASLNFEDNNLLRPNEVNLFISIENCYKWNWYSHYNKYGKYENRNFDIFIYNHISSVKKRSRYIGIPAIHFRIRNYKLIEPLYVERPFLNCRFEDKKFMLVSNKSKLNPDIIKYIDLLKPLGDIHYINEFNDKLLNSSCYNSDELLEVYNGFKFVLCFENSYTDGYITEKIFNCFLSKNIPIYCGSPIIDEFINKDSFIDARNDNFINQINKLNADKGEYLKMINQPKISSKYDDEGFMKLYTKRFRSKISENKNTSIHKM